MKINYVSLCSGYGAECIALKRLRRDYPDFDFECLAWSEIEVSAIKAHDAIHPEYKGRNLNDLTLVDWKAWHESIGSPHIDLLFASTPCFVAGTWVRTSNGLKKIECIEAGDYVLTHTNAYKKVLKPMKRDYQGVTYSLECSLFESLVCTSEHPLYVRAKRKGHTATRNFGEPQWLSPKEMMRELTKEPIRGIAQVRGYHIGYAINQESKLPEWNYQATTWKQQGDLINSMIGKGDFWYLMGRYVGDGWKRINGKYGNCLIICCSERNRESLYAALGNLGLHGHGVKERTVEKVFISRNELVAFVERYGYYAHGKRVDAETINLPVPLLQRFLDGVMDSDGHREGNWCHITSVSEELVYDLGQCVAKAYHRPFSVYKTERPKTTVIEGREVNQRDSWTVKWKTTDDKQDRAFYENGHIWSPIMKLTWQQSRQSVYNMEVEEDNSYTANGVIVHNCQSVSNAGKNEGMKKGTDAESALIWATESCIRALNPDIIIYENVKGMVSKRNKPDFDEWCATLVSLGYVVQWKILNSRDFSVAQNRERIFPIAIRKDMPMAGHYNFPSPMPLTKCVEDYMEPAEEVGEEYYIDQKRVTDKVLSDILDQPNVREEMEKLYHEEWKANID